MRPERKSSSHQCKSLMWKHYKVELRSLFWRNFTGREMNDRSYMVFLVWWCVNLTDLVINLRVQNK